MIKMMASNLFLTMGSDCIAPGSHLNISYRISEYQNFDHKIINGKLNGHSLTCIFKLLEARVCGLSCARTRCMVLIARKACKIISAYLMAWDGLGDCWPFCTASFHIYKRLLNNYKSFCFLFWLFLFQDIYVHISFKIHCSRFPSAC